MATHHAEQDESYFVSMTDLMVGMLFVFIILLMAFALNLKEQETQLKEQETKLTQTDKAREEMLRDIETALKNKGIPVTVLPESGVLRLPEQVLFDVNKAVLQPRGWMRSASSGKPWTRYSPAMPGTDQYVRGGHSGAWNPCSSRATPTIPVRPIAIGNSPISVHGQSMYGSWRHGQRSRK